MGKSVLVALSGGLDSSMTAILLMKKGYKVTCLHLNFISGIENQSKLKGVKEFCDQLEFPLIVKNLEAEFNKSVVEYFSSEYAMGKTPCPCSYCNANFKWKFLYQYAKDNNFNFIATGHYVRTTYIDSKWYIRRGIDKAKDQSYFLWKLNQEQISKTITPLGEYTKGEVREMALKLGFDKLARKPESMGICFLQGEDYRSFLMKRDSRQHLVEGDIVDTRGNHIGKHNGVQNYTVGQKKGVMNLPKGFCIVEIIPSENKLVIGPWDSLFYKIIKLSEYNLNGLGPGEYLDFELNIRGFGKNPEGKCKLILDNVNNSTIYLDNPAWAPSPGQAAVLYQGDKLIGGGYLYGAEN